MVVGESGLGKSTLVDSLFDTDIYPERIVPSAGGKSLVRLINISVGLMYDIVFALNFCTEKIKKTVKVEASTVEIEERGVKLRLTVVDTPGYGDGIDNTDR